MDFLCRQLKDNLIQNPIVIWNINATVVVALLQNLSFKRLMAKESEVAVFQRWNSGGSSMRKNDLCDDGSLHS